MDMCCALGGRLIRRSLKGRIRAEEDRRIAKNDLYAERGSAIAQRVAITVVVGACVAIAWWLLFGAGIAIAGAWLGQRWIPGDAPRRLFLAVALSIYFLRLLFTQFVFLKRAVSWREAWMIAPWVLCIYLVISIAGGTNPARMGAPSIAGAVLFVFGSWMNSYAEYARHVWKQRPSNQGRLYTLGLFRYSMHPNYLGDLISFSGLSLITGRWITIAIPVIMLGGFIFANIPMLDSHLHEHYGRAFDEYASRTRKLIPFVY
jgi:protein-S-isoprenylcysteine O-methyltransferase Ste14